MMWIPKDQLTFIRVSDCLYYRIDPRELRINDRNDETSICHVIKVEDLQGERVRFTYESKEGIKTVSLLEYHNYIFSVLVPEDIEALFCLKLVEQIRNCLSVSSSFRKAIALAGEELRNGGI